MTVNQIGRGQDAVFAKSSHKAPPVRYVRTA
jgi:hypothetical protein